MSRGAVTVPAPTPVIAIKAAIRKPKASSIAISSVSLDVNSAFELLAGPATGAGIGGIGGKRGARRASDAGIALLVQREQGNAVQFGVVPDIARGPLGQRAELVELVARGQGKLLFGL